MSKETFDFSEALKRMRQGKKVTRRDWLKGSYVYIKYGLFIHRFKAMYGFEEIAISKHNWVDGKLSTDWEEVEE